MIKFKKVENIKELAALASGIWHEYWVGLLSSEQIDYMVEKFQSEKAIKNQINNEKYEYYFIIYENKNVGYFGISYKKGYLFLSKLYIKRDFRHHGFGTEAFDKIKRIAVDAGYKKIILTVNKYNTNTINAYKKWGLKTIDAVVADIGNGFVRDDFIMEYSC